MAPASPQILRQRSDGVVYSRSAMRAFLLPSVLTLAACGSPSAPHGGDAGGDPGGDASGPGDAPPEIRDGGTRDARASDDGGLPADGGPADGGMPHDGGVLLDGGLPLDGGSAPDAPPPMGPISGGPCASGAAGQTAYRIRFAGNGSGSTAYVVYEVNGLPDPTDHAGVYGTSIGYTPQFVDVFLAQGGVRLDGGNFIDLELSTVGLASIQSATLSIYGRSFHTTASGSFHWQSFDGVGAAPVNLVSNAAPYAWYSADMTSEISAGDDGVLLRIKAGPSSGVLVVNRIEICMQAS